MRYISLLGFCVLLACTATKETAKTSATTEAVTPVQPATIQVDQAIVSKDIRYLASDELGGRGTGSKGIEMASKYISQVFAEAKVIHVEGKNRYTQSVPLVEQEAAISATFKVADKTYELTGDLLVLQQTEVNASGRVLFLGQEDAEVISTMDLNGAIAVTMAGSPEEGDPRAFYQLAKQKQKAVAQAGGIALIELYRSPRAPFSQVARFFGAGGLQLADKENSSIPLLWLNDPKGENLQVMDEAAGTAAQLSLKPGKKTVVPADNIIGFIPGTDTRFADEVIVVGAHYDHLGIDGSRGAQDSIFNGARDNAIGTAALLGIARHFGANPGKRPILLAAWTAEERGLLGSKYFVKEPWLPKEKLVFNLNLDGAGYDDTTSVTMNGYGRTTMQASIDLAIAELGILPNPDPVPEMQLYQFSDNWSFAEAGIPALNLAPGFTGFSPALMKYYHQAGDHVESLDFAYVTRYVKAAVAAAETVVNGTDRPAWTPGDELAPVKK